VQKYPTRGPLPFFGRYIDANNAPRLWMVKTFKKEFLDAGTKA
jgi:hypothetical protein